MVKCAGEQEKRYPKTRAEPRGTVWRKPERKAINRRTETAYNAESPGEFICF
jgi:hypothetical protein